MNEIVNNKVNLCDSCSQTYPGCTSKPENVYFGDGIGHDNICACSEYQPETHEERTETHACDCISRQTALQAMDTWDKFGCDPDGRLVRYDDDKHYVPYVHYDDMVHAIKHLPSAQSEIIHCRDCKYFHPSYCEVWSRYGTVQTREDGFCYKAERKTDA